MVRGGPEARFHEGSTRGSRVPPGSARAEGSARAAGWCGVVCARAPIGPLEPPLHRRARSGPLIAPLRPDRARAPIAPVGPRSGPVGTPEPSGPDQPCFIKLQGGILSDTGSEGVPRGFWEGVGLLGISPELILKNVG